MEKGKKRTTEHKKEEKKRNTIYIYNYRGTYNNYWDMTLHDIKWGNKNYLWMTILKFDTFNNFSGCIPICNFVYTISVCINKTHYNNAYSPFREHSGRFLQ